MNSTIEQLAIYADEIARDYGSRIRAQIRTARSVRFCVCVSFGGPGQHIKDNTFATIAEAESFGRRWQYESAKVDIEPEDSNWIVVCVRTHTK